MILNLEGNRAGLARVLCLAAVLLGLWVSSPAGRQPAADQSRTITVDCAKGQSIGAALKKAASFGSPVSEWLIEIHGMCEEDVEVRLDDVTLRGTDPATDGIRGVGAGDVRTTAVLTVRGGARVGIENLTVTGGARNGLAVFNAPHVEVTNCRLSGNERYGAWIGEASWLFATDLQVRGNGRGGIVATAGSHLTCVGCVIDDRALFALWTQLGARATLRQSELVSANNWAIVGYAASEIMLQDSRVAGSTYGLVVRSHDGVRLTRVQLDGAVWLDAKSSLELFEATQTSNPRVNNVFNNSSVRLAHGSTLVGPTLLEDFSTLSLRGGSTHAGDAHCNSASDLFCESPSMVVGQTFGCGRCPTASAGDTPGAGALPPTGRLELEPQSL